MESPEPVTGGGDPDVGVTEGQAVDRVWDGVREPRSIFVAHETKFQSRALEPWTHCWGVLSSVDQHFLHNWSQLTRQRTQLMKLPAAAYFTEVATSATKAGSYEVFGEEE